MTHDSVEQSKSGKLIVSLVNRVMVCVCVCVCDSYFQNENFTPWKKTYIGQDEGGHVFCGFVCSLVFEFSL